MEISFPIEDYNPDTTVVFQLRTVRGFSSFALFVFLHQRPKHKIITGRVWKYGLETETRQNFSKKITNFFVVYLTYWCLSEWISQNLILFFSQNSVNQK